MSGIAHIANIGFYLTLCHDSFDLGDFSESLLNFFA